MYGARLICYRFHDHCLAEWVPALKTADNLPVGDDDRPLDRLAGFRVNQPGVELNCVIGSATLKPKDGRNGNKGPVLCKSVHRSRSLTSNRTATHRRRLA